ncbi:MAG: histidine kinase [Azoarcus sp.]|nr:histidine kinase [Azoarcus sp.]
MDLRVRLLAFLSVASVALLLAACLVIAASLREDVAEELTASAHLVELMRRVSAAPEQGSGPIGELIAEEQLRHVQVALGRSDLEQAFPLVTPSELAGWAYRLTGTDGGALEVHRIELGGDEAIFIRADPRSEIDEIMGDGVRMLSVLLLFAMGSILAAWYAADRALRPVRALEEGLARLARGEPHPVLPRFELKEFRRVAASIEELAEALVHARANERRLGHCIMALQEAERRELARELHDEFGQSLTAIGAAAAFVEMHAPTADPKVLSECARDIRAESVQMSVHVRGLLRQLRPHGLEGLGMGDGLRELVDTWRQRSTGIGVELDMPEVLPPLTADAGLALYRTVQEALTNVLRHSGASRVRICIETVAGMLVLTVADDGCGRAVDVLRNARGGLLGMRERAEMAGGALQLGASLLGGLGIRLELPINENGDKKNDQDPVA